MKALRNLYRRLWLWVRLRYLWVRQQIAHDRFMMQADLADTVDEASAAMKRVIDARLFPPDCLSGGTMRGGPALFLRTDHATEVFIGHSYEHAADELLKWWRTEREAGLAPPTTTTTRMNRKQRRAWASKDRKNLSTG